LKKTHTHTEHYSTPLHYTPATKTKLKAKKLSRIISGAKTHKNSEERHTERRVVSENSEERQRQRRVVRGREEDSSDCVTREERICSLF
jgi:hypothetical protein